MFRSNCKKRVEASPVFWLLWCCTLRLVLRVSFGLDSGSFETSFPVHPAGSWRRSFFCVSSAAVAAAASGNGRRHPQTHRMCHLSRFVSSQAQQPMELSLGWSHNRRCESIPFLWQCGMLCLRSLNTWHIMLDNYNYPRWILHTVLKKKRRIIGRKEETMKDEK